MGRKTIIGIVLAVILVVIVVVFLTTSLKNRTPGKTPDNAPVEQTQNVVSVVSDPLVYDGLNVTLPGTVNDWVTKRVFTLAQQPTGTFGNGGAQIIVISPDEFTLSKFVNPDKFGLGEPDKVTVKGRVTIMDRAQLGQAIGYDLDGEDIELDSNSVISSWTRGSVLLLTSVKRDQ